MRTFKEYLAEVAKKRGQSVVTKNKDDLSTTYKEHKVGDVVQALQPDNSSYKRGVVHRVGRTMVHVKHDNGEVSAYAPEHIGVQDMKGNKI